MERATLSIIKADVGGWPGHSTVHPDLLVEARSRLDAAAKEGTIEDFHVTHVGDDLNLIMTHDRGEDDAEVHGVAFDVFTRCTRIAEKLGLYGAGQDILSDAFSGNVRGMGPGVAEMTFTRRVSEPFVAFLLDKTAPSAFNFPIYKMFADPFNTAGLVIDPNLHLGFAFEVWDVKEHRRIMLRTPEETYTLLALIGAEERYVIKRVFPREGHKLPADEPVAVISTERLADVAGRYVGKDDPVAIVRSQSGLPALGEVLEPFTLSHLVSGWMRGSHHGPLIPVGQAQAMPTRFDGPPRAVALGFDLSPESRLIGPVDLFADVAFDRARARALKVADYLRAHGPFEPHRLPLEEMEYTTLPGILGELRGRWETIEGGAPQPVTAR